MEALTCSAKQKPTTIRGLSSAPVSVAKKMGGVLGSNQQVNETQIIDNTMELLSNTAVKRMASTTNQADIEQIIDISGEDVSNVTQDAVLTFDSTSKITSSDAVKLANNIADDLKNQVNRQTDSTADVLKSLWPWGSNNTQNLIEHSLNGKKMSMIFTSETINQMISKIAVKQTINISGKRVQGIHQSTAANIVTKMIMDSKTGHEIQNDISAVVKQYNEQKASGLSSTLLILGAVAIGFAAWYYARDSGNRGGGGGGGTNAPIIITGGGAPAGTVQR